MEQSELCYECVNCINCYDLQFSRFCKTCSESAFLVDCIGCKYCLGCANLYQKEYHIFNQPYSKEDYKKKVAEFKLRDYKHLQAFKIQFEDFCAQQIKKQFRGLMNENVSGDNIVQCKDTFESYDVGDLRDCKFCTNMIVGGKDCYDVNIWGDNLQRAYNCACVGAGTQDVVASYYIAFQARNIYHSAFCWHNVHDLLGCVAVSHKSYCVFNKQYSEEEYKKLFSQIKEHMLQTREWGEFFPPDISPFGYNETVAQEYFPLKKEQVLSMKSYFGGANLNSHLQAHWKWHEEKEPDFSGITKKIPARKLPDTIENVPDDILNWAIECAESKHLFRIQKAELDLYRKMNLPIPHYHPNIRHKHRQQLRNPRQLFNRQCANCQKQIQTTYHPSRAETVYCEECYIEAVY